MVRSFLKLYIVSFPEYVITAGVTLLFIKDSPEVQHISGSVLLVYIGIHVSKKIHFVKEFSFMNILPQ